MATQRYISTSFWDDAWIHKLDPSEKLMFLYLMTNPLTNIAGIYRLSVDRIVYDTGFNEHSVRHILEKFEQMRKVFLFQEYVIIRTWPKHQQWDKRNKIKLAIIAVLQQVEPEVLDFASAMGYEFPLELVNETVIGHLARKGISGSQKKRIIERDGGRCVKCGSNKDLHIHHLVHVANGGDNSDGNLETLCSRCHIAAHKDVQIPYADVRIYLDSDRDRDLDKNPLTPPLQNPEPSGPGGHAHSSTEIEGFFKLWNACGLPEFRRLLLNVPEAGKLRDALSYYTTDEIESAIKAYATAKLDPAYEVGFGYANVVNFLIKGIEVFAPGAKPLERFAAKTPRTQEPNVDQLIAEAERISQARRTQV